MTRLPEPWEPAPRPPEWRGECRVNRIETTEDLLPFALKVERTGRYAKYSRPATPWSLTPGQAMVVRLLAQGMTSQEVAESLKVVHGAVESQLCRAKKRMQAPSTEEAIRMWKEQADG